MLERILSAYLRWRDMGHLVPFLEGLTHLGRPSTVLVPSELLEQGAAILLSGLNNTMAIQSNHDWVWPLWVERQADPSGGEFIPTAINLIMTNLTCRNWTSVGLEDSPREEAAVVLDARAGTDVGTPPDSSFEMQVRVAASILRRLVTTGQRAALITNGARLDRLPVTSGEGDWRGALEFLAGVQADGRNGLAAALEDGRGTLEAQRLYLVTAELTPRLADRVGTLAVRREIAVAWVDARTWNGARAEPGLAEGVALTLARMGVPLARVRRGDDLRRVLDPRGDAGHAPAGDGHHRERTAVPA